MSDISRELLETLEDLIDNNIANKDTKSEFIICYTHGEDIPRYWSKAKEVAKRARSELKGVKQC